ncbi:MAG: flagellar biosynthesis anti-sigma factor FlgM [Novosphingobium sp.]|jgi:negative regulator of flagellin synthesis FlgM
MPPIDLPPIRPTGPVEPRQNQPLAVRPQVSAQPEVAAPAVEVDAALTASKPPVDTGRITEIRKAIDEGRYPVIPMRVADALIASGLLLRSGK